MTKESIDGFKYLKRKVGQPMTDIEKKKLERKELSYSHYATGYYYYIIIKN